jgi:hypothetical protein
MPAIHEITAITMRHFDPNMHPNCRCLLSPLGIPGCDDRFVPSFVRRASPCPPRKSICSQPQFVWSEFYRIINEVPTVLMVGIVILVIVKPFSQRTIAGDQGRHCHYTD